MKSQSGPEPNDSHLSAFLKGGIELNGSSLKLQPLLLPLGPTLVAVDWVRDMPEIQCV
jgi:hypothetical protein